MFPASVDYRRAESVDDALSLLAADDTEVLAGGHALIPDMKDRQRDPDTLVDVSDVPGLRGVETETEGVTVGALTTYADALDAPELADVPVLRDALSEVGDLQVRNRGTVGGNLAQADPDGDLPAAALAADARLLVRSSDSRRRVDATDFFRGPNATALGDDELLTAVRFPATGNGGAYVRKTHPASGYALVGVGACVSVENGTVADARVGVTGATEYPIRLRAVEKAISGVDVTDHEAVDDAAAATTDDLPVDLRGDEHASAEFRGHLLGVHTAEALGRALDRAVTARDGARNGDEPVSGGGAE